LGRDKLKINSRKSSSRQKIRLPIVYARKKLIIMEAAGIGFSSLKENHNNLVIIEE
jgi:hypothetical protein